MKNGLKILYVSDSRLMSERANSIQVVKTCEALTGIGCDVTLALPGRGENKLHTDEEIWPYYNIKTKFKIVRLPVLDAKIVNKLRIPHLWFFVSTGTFALSVLEYLRKNKDFDVIYTRHLESAAILSRMKPSDKTRIIFEAHKFSRLQLKALANVDGITTLTKPLAQLYNPLKKPTSVIPDATDVSEFSPRRPQAEIRGKLNLPKDKKILGYIGRFQTLGKEKGIEEIIKSAKYLDKRLGSKVLFLFVGGPISSVPEYERLIAKEALDHSLFEFRDRVPYTEVKDLLNAVDICLMPFPDIEHYAKYMSPMKMFEYMASKNPIIATNLPSVRDVLVHEKTALLVRPDDPKDLARAENRLVLDKSLSKRLSDAAFKSVSENYTWEKRAESLFDFLERLKAQKT